MRLIDAQNLALDLMKLYGLIHWTFRFGKGKRIFGTCSHGKKEISLSSVLSLLNDESVVRNIILHEIAHALVDVKHGHDDTWRAMCRTIGARTERCYNSWSVVIPPRKPPKYVITCPSCGYRLKRRRYRVLACTACCKKHNGGKFTKKFMFQWQEAA